MELDRRARVHLEWMFENQPELCRQLSAKLMAFEGMSHQNMMLLNHSMSSIWVQ